MSGPQTIADRPWEALPPEVAPVLRGELAPLSDEIVEAIRASVAEYAQPLEGTFGRTVRLGVDEALKQFVELIERPEGGRGAGHEVYVNLGRGEMRTGRSLDSLLSAYRLGARAAWGRSAAAGERPALSPRTLYLLAESIFAYIDELSADSIEGYAREQAAAAGAHQQRRQRLAAPLGREAPARRADAAATAAGRLPRTLAVLVVEADDSSDGADRLAIRLGPGALVAHMPPFN